MRERPNVMSGLHQPGRRPPPSGGCGTERACPTTSIRAIDRSTEGRIAAGRGVVIGSGRKSIGWRAWNEVGRGRQPSDRPVVVHARDELCWHPIRAVAYESHLNLTVWNARQLAAVIEQRTWGRAMRSRDIAALESAWAVR